MNYPWTREDVLRQLRGDDLRAALLAAQGTDKRLERAERNNSRGVDPVSLSDAQGQRAILDAAAGMPEVLDGLRRCGDALHRSVWLFVHHQPVFQRACWLDAVQTLGYSAMHYQVGQAKPALDGATLHAMCGDIRSLYWEHYRRGDRCSVRSIQQLDGIVSIVVDLTDVLPPDVQQAGVHRCTSGAAIRYGSASMEVRLDYVPATGHLRVFLRGEPRCHLAVMRAFARHVLRSPSEGMPGLAELDLQGLLYRLTPPDAVADGFTQARVVSMALSRGSDATRIHYQPPGWRPPADSAREGIVRDLGFDPTRTLWQVDTVCLALRLPGDRGEIEIHLAQNGSTNLYRFDPQVQARVERYLGDLSLMDPSQMLYGRLERGALADKALEALPVA
jgi:hypothetical protein